MAGLRLAARRLLAPAIAAAVLASSCILPSYSVGGATGGDAAGGATSSGHAGGGAGAHEPTASTVGVGSGGAGIGGAGIGGNVGCGGTPKNGKMIATTASAHGVTVSPSYVYWIGTDDDVVYYSPRQNFAASAFAIEHACGISGGQASGVDQVVIRTSDGVISVGLPSTGAVKTALPAVGDPPDGPGPCAISEDSNGDVAYGFDKSAGVYSLMKYRLVGGKRSVVIGAMGTPVAIDATNDAEVAWLEALGGNGSFFSAKKKHNALHGDIPGGPAFNHLCAYGQQGTFAFTDSGIGEIDTWSISGHSGYLTNKAGTWSGIACTAAHQVWMESDAAGCATIRSRDTSGGPVTDIATEQPHACSIAIGGADVYWTTCEPAGGVYTAKVP